MKKMMISLFLICVPIASQAVELCEKELASTYSVSTNNSQHTLSIYFGKDRVLQVFEEKKLADEWNQIPDGRLKLTRFFDQEKHAIEYQPGDAIDGGTLTWDQINMGVPSTVKDSMALVSRSGSGCDMVEAFQSADGQMKFIWNPEKKRLIEYQTPSVHWKLREQPLMTSQAAFALRDDYRTIDYADIGDSEDDPFVRKMIRMGFVSHGASGFYDEHGHALDSGHNH